ncbi:hypothetical protein QBC46DRAFT_343356 [Diplogelasinospora grovesii]|uniref:Uncharacterized protein n=1 Tax=Diplogelasinospora grovesii TaxID=303347 RepID=A0AAN6N4I2_9PEZI|nr:hypothetical protein QBC46DRAFT_343356 [Diplogelasinospora grovesii]
MPGKRLNKVPEVPGIAPGIMWVHSHITSDALTPDVFTKWYEEVHIPDMMATKGGPKTVLRYGWMESPSPKDMRYLTIYFLDDMGWLHFPGCELWGLPLHNEMLPGPSRFIGDFAHFDTRFYEEINTTVVETAATHEVLQVVEPPPPPPAKYLASVTFDLDIDDDKLEQDQIGQCLAHTAAAPPLPFIRATTYRLQPFPGGGGAMDTIEKQQVEHRPKFLRLAQFVAQPTFTDNSTLAPPRAKNIQVEMFSLLKTFGTDGPDGFLKGNR